jgi:hypothetical protein
MEARRVSEAARRSALADTARLQWSGVLINLGVSQGWKNMVQQTNPPSRYTIWFLAAFLLVQIGCQSNEPASDAAAAANKLELAAEGEPAVELVIDYGDGVEKRLHRIPFREGMTAKDAMDSAARHPRGIAYQKKGSGELAMLTAIDDLANQAGSAGKNWLFRVNGELATKSFDAYELSPGDVILWKFEDYK